MHEVAKLVVASIQMEKVNVTFPYAGNFNMGLHYLLNNI